MNIQLEEGGSEIRIDLDSINAVGSIEHVYSPENWFTRLLGFEDLDYYKYIIYTGRYKFEIVRNTYEEAVADREAVIWNLVDMRECYHE